MTLKGTKGSQNPILSGRPSTYLHSLLLSGRQELGVEFIAHTGSGKASMPRWLSRSMVDRVECVRVGRTKWALNTAVYFYRVGDVLVDTGSPNQSAAVREFASLHRNRLRTVLVTHHHEDHGGNGAMLQREFGMRVFAPQNAIQPLRGM